MMYALLKGLMRLLVRVFLAGGLFQVVGDENVPRRGPLLVVANHRSTIDPPLLPAFLPRPDGWSMAKSEWFAKPGFTRWLFSSYQAFPVIRHSADRRALRRARQILEDGQALVVYPEGRRVESGILEEPEPGSGFIAQTVGAPVLPVGLVGTAECFPKGARWPRRTRVEVRFGKPFRLRQRLPDGTRVSREQASDAIMLRIAELLPPELRGRYADLEAVRAGVASVYDDPESGVSSEGAEPSPPRSARPGQG